MAQWRKILTSGSNIEVAAITASQGIINPDGAVNTFLSGSFSGSFYGDGSNLTGLGTFNSFTLSDGNNNQTIENGNTLTITGSSNTGVTVVVGATDKATISLSGIPNSSLTNSSLTVSAGDGLQNGGAISLGGSATLNIDVSDFAGTGLEDDGSENLRIAAAAAGNGLTGGGGSALSVQVSGSTLVVGATGVAVNANGITATELNSSVAGTGLSGGGGSALSVDYGSSAGDAVEGNTTISFGGTANEIVIDEGSSITLGSGGTVTIGLADTISGSRTFADDVTVLGDLYILGTTTTIDTAKLLVEDQLIFLGTGSAAANVDAGIVVQSGSVDLTGSALYHDIDSQRWSVAKSVSEGATAITPEQFITTVTVSGGNDNPSAVDYGAGEMYLKSNGEVWIYS